MHLYREFIYHHELAPINMKNKFYLLLLLLLPFSSFAQVIPLTNPSFEGVPRHSQLPKGWYDCGFPGESPPDTQPDPYNTFQVRMNAYEGRTYLGLVVRDNDTWESISQKLPQALEKDTCYTFSVFAAQSDNYISLSRATYKEVNYNTPVIIRLYGGFDYCEKTELLVASDPIVNNFWREFKFTFRPSKAYKHIVIEANYNTISYEPYNGNLLLDAVQLEKGCSSQ